MKTKLLKTFSFLSCFLLFSLSGYSQVGIGTTNPQEALHVAGEDSTIRIDGLNSSNNSDNNGTRTHWQSMLMATLF